MIRMYAALILTLFGTTLMAQVTTFPLYPAEYPKVIPPEKQMTTDENGYVKNIHYPTVDVYSAPADKAVPCGIIICPGGGYWIEAANHEGKDIAKMLNGYGITAFLLRYRLPPDYPHPVPMQDAQRAIRFVRANRGQWGIKAGRIGILGFSAGGHLASTAATHFDAGKPDAADEIERQSCRPDFAVLGYPVISFTKDYCHAGARAQLIGSDLPYNLMVSLSSELQVSKDTPPTFLFHSQDDSGVDPRNSIDFFLACKDNKVPAELHLFPTGGHGFGLGKGDSSESQWPTLLAKFLEQQGFLKK